MNAEKIEAPIPTTENSDPHPDSTTTIQNAAVDDDDAPLLSTDDVPMERLSKLRLFLLFLGFGCQAFGGPVAQINMMKVEAGGRFLATYLASGNF
jgi:hypothetical protein